MHIQTSAQVIINAHRNAVFDASTNSENLPKFFKGYKSIPAIVSAKTVDGLALHEGSIRIVSNSDGSSIQEVIASLRRPEIQEYELLGGFKPPFSWLVSSASGRWTYEAIAAKTKVTWQFKFRIRNVLAHLIFRLLVKRSFERAQQICLENLKNFVESEGGIASH